MEDPNRTAWETRMCSMLGKQVRVIMQRNPVEVAKTGELLWFEDSGEFCLRDEIGFVLYGWPNLQTTLLSSRQCISCDKARPHHAHGLCDSCYSREFRQGKYTGSDRAKRMRAELLSEFAFLKKSGCTNEQAAKRLKVSMRTVERAQQRERQARA